MFDPAKRITAVDALRHPYFNTQQQSIPQALSNIPMVSSNLNPNMGGMMPPPAGYPPYSQQAQQQVQQQQQAQQQQQYASQGGQGGQPAGIIPGPPNIGSLPGILPGPPFPAGYSMPPPPGAAQPQYAPQGRESRGVYQQPQQQQQPQQSSQSSQQQQQPINAPIPGALGHHPLPPHLQQHASAYGPPLSGIQPMTMASMQSAGPPPDVQNLVYQANMQAYQQQQQQQQQGGSGGYGGYQ